MPIDQEVALERALSEGGEWQSWRALRLAGDPVDGWPTVTDQEETGGFRGASGRLSPGATGMALCRFVVIGVPSSPASVIAADWLEAARTPAKAWLDSPDDVPGRIDDVAGARVWATASAACGLLAVGRDPGPRAIQLLSTDTDQEGYFTGGAYPTFAAAGAYWLAEGANTETAEWALRWTREWADEWWGPRERAAALTYWGAAGVPPEHASVDEFLEQLRSESPPAGWPDDVELTLVVLELLRHFGW